MSIPPEKGSFISPPPSGPFPGLGKILGTVVFLADRRHRRIVQRNLRFIYPQWSPEEVQSVSRRVFQNVGMTFFEILQMRSFTCEEVLRKVRIRGKENLLSATQNPKGAIFISAHLGNWEMSQIYAACLLKTPPVLVARKIQPDFLDTWVTRFRTRFGSIMLDKGGALPRMARALRRGALVGLLIDQGTLRSEGVEVEFLGKTATTTPAAALLARRFGSPVLPAYCIREEDGGLTMFIEPPLPLAKSEDRRADIRENTQRMNDALERAIRAYPDQWFWFHKRWKRHYPHLYPEDATRRRRQKEKRKAKQE
jgi:Kdo2-lipid IVA lauroyltransferase/acyltransferase